MTFPDPDPRWTTQEVAQTIRRRSLWMEVLGLLLIALGVIAVSSAVLASLATTLLIGGLLLVAGAAQIGVAVAFWRRRRGGFALGIVLGVLCLGAGTLCLIRPASSLAAITFILGGYFIGSGAVRFLINQQERFPGWGWGVVSAVSELLLGVLMIAFWPTSSLFVLGTILGVQLIFSGVATFNVGLAVRRILASHPEPQDVEHHHRPATRFQH
jgi:uncharacterized membrane protein HdeD (DUF308 family)